MMPIQSDSSPRSRIRGFSVDNSEVQYALEAAFDSHLDPDQLRNRMRILSARPHHVGSPYSRELADFIAVQFRNWGFDTRVEEYHVLIPKPTKQNVELLFPERFTATFVEPPISGDSFSKSSEYVLPAFNAFSAAGDVTGEVAYVNYGTQDDYDELALRGVDVAGKIVIARYGKVWRGLKPKLAAANGAIGCLIYSDPRDDGYFHGSVYPDGPYRPEHGVQRGSVGSLPFKGDPLTPNAAATKDAKRLDPSELELTSKIPVLPLSYADALPILQELTGPVAAEHWRGALPITYHLGPGPARVRLQVEFDWEISPAYDVIAKLEGADYPDQWIIRGNHHDAWVYGAGDPVSGLVAMMEEARSIGMLADSGWRPKRTLIFAAWDAEEIGLMGSTEWAEQYRDVLTDNAVAYINTDGNGRGFLFAGGSHILENMVADVARTIPDPDKGIAVSDRAVASQLLNGIDRAIQKNVNRPEFQLAALGGGSDWVTFQQHLGVPSLHLAYARNYGGGEYHSLYDSFDYYQKFGDPTFEYGVTLAKTTGRISLRLANSEILPYEFRGFSASVRKFMTEVIEFTNDMRAETDKENLFIERGVFDAVSDDLELVQTPDRKEAVPYVNFAPLKNALEALDASALGYARRLSEFYKSEQALSDEVIRALNASLLRLERTLLQERGLPERPWFRHSIYAGGMRTGYGVKTLPGVREAIEAREWKIAEEQIKIVAATLTNFASALERTTNLFSNSEMERIK
ncbi:MAG: folate hydrolase [Gammaproteobacteria bacterium]|nr:MAG: folate hydrolase [Gammaproteobacteria bacterium]